MSRTVLTIVYKNFNKLLKSSGMTIKEISIKTGINEMFLYKIKDRQAKRLYLSHIEKLCECFQVDIRQLID
ncbi:helix-turn-helix transcriptional regulator [bacterium]|nr:helix-turn-helix transcriptional regulator [bacterium]